MKHKFFLLIITSFSTLLVLAQKKSWYVGGQAGFNSSQSKQINPVVIEPTARFTNWSFSPEIGTFLRDDIQLGFGITYSGSQSKDLQNTNNKIIGTNYGLKTYVRKFWGKNVFKPFVGFNVEYLNNENRSTSGSTTLSTTGNTFGTNFNAGFGYSLSKRVNVLGSFGVLGFNTSTSKQSNNSTQFRTTNFGFDAGTLGNRFNIGFYYTL